MIRLNNEEREFKRIFINFLKEENAYTIYIKDFNKLHRKLCSKLSTPLGSNYDYSFNSFIKYYNKRSSSYLEDAFIWEDSEMKCDFWYELSVKEERLWVYGF